MIKLENDQHKLLERRYLIFFQLYEKLSVKETAKYFETSSSNISTQVTKLSKELNYPLFMRTKYGLEATTQADILYQDLQKIFKKVKPIYDDFIHKITAMNQSSTMIKRRIYIRRLCYDFFSEDTQRLLHENFSVTIYDKLAWSELPTSAIVIDVDDSTQYLGTVQASVVIDELMLFAVDDLNQCTTLYYSGLAAPYYRHVAETLAKSGYSISQCKASSNIPLMLSMPKSIFLTSQKAYYGLANISHKLQCHALNHSMEQLKFSIAATKYDQDVAMIESLLGKLNLNKNNTTEASLTENEWSVAC